MQNKKIVSISRRQELTKASKLIIKGTFREDGICIVEPKLDFDVLTEGPYTRVIHIKNPERIVKVSTEFEVGSDTLYPLKNEWFMLDSIKKLKDKDGINYVQFPIENGQWINTANGKIYPCIHYEYSDKGDAMDMVNNYNDHLIPKHSMDIMVDKVIRQLLMGLTFLHERDILHGDIKLENLLIVEGSAEEPENLQIKIIDFENAKILKRGETHTSNIHFGTLICLAPESEKYKQYSHKSDMFAAGCTIYHLHTKEEPPLKRNWCPSISGIVKELQNKTYNRTRTDKKYSTVILKLVKNNPSEREQAKETLKIWDCSIETDVK